MAARGPLRDAYALGQKGLTAVELDVCAVSGAVPGPHCPHAKTWFIPGVSPISVCEIHREILVDRRTGRRACQTTGTRTETFEFWPSDLSVLLNRALQRIEHVVDSMRASLDNVAHDLRTLMTRLRGIAELSLASPASVESYREALSDCLEESANIVTMLDALLEISEVEAGSIDLDLAEVDVAGVVARVVEMYGVVAEEEGVSLDAVCPVPLIIVADRSRVVQAIANLVDNAVKYTRRGGSVRVEAHLDATEVVVLVRDTGIGIPAHEADRVWDRSFRGDASRSKRGLGLGLSLVRAVARAHGGGVEMVSEPGSGSEFTLRLPVARPVRL